MQLASAELSVDGINNDSKYKRLQLPQTAMIIIVIIEMILTHIGTLKKSIGSNGKIICQLSNEYFIRQYIVEKKRVS